MFSVSSAWSLPWSKVLWLLLNKCFFNVADKKVYWLNILFLIHGWCLVYSYNEDDPEYLQDQKWGGEDDVGDSSSLHLQLLCSMGSQLFMVAKPSQMTCLPSSLPSTSRIITKGSGRLCMPAQRHFWNLSEHLVLLAFADDDTELELKSKILDKLLDSEVPEPFKIGKPDLLVVVMSTELSDLVVHRAGSFWKWQMLSKWRWRSGKEERPISPLTLSSTL
jgi:hypothetical protein